ncbi:exosortase/archaeosortase family protein [Rhodoblastus acidophilus]|uniref:exosortase/archaeosortase family protein n=1 Tax=Rhodoblastus acidophilus TaxID=1074 RepID=UPI0022254266|nr:exosortase/archaeosortase family protein [Rhodoblastus acidophilus]MCW2283834.1 exosortase/archaeosortase family protein [Rhodoblastus acidophilus]MCW2335628.1 exosortase/archaeosortase family protein [Rhodoblastus acidophilus]
MELRATDHACGSTEGETFDGFEGARQILWDFVAGSGKCIHIVSQLRSTVSSSDKDAAVKIWQRVFVAGGGYPLLISFAALMDVRRTAAFALNRFYDFGQALSLVEGVNYLLLAEWIYIVSAAWKADWSAVKPGWVERGLGLFVTLVALFGVAAAAHWPTIAVCILIAARLSFQPNLRWLGFCLVAVAVQNLFVRPELDSIHGAFAHLDAWITHHFLAATGFANDLRGVVLQLQGANFAIEVQPACATSGIIPAVLIAFFIFTLGRRISASSLALGAVVAVGACFVLNILRLSLMAQSEAYAHYWHEGEGTSILSLAMCVIAYWTASAVAHYDERRQDAQVIGPPENLHV